MKFKIVALLALVPLGAIRLEGNPIPSGFATSIVGPVTITAPGQYRVSFDIAGPIIIDADHVQLDLNNSRITGGTNVISANNHQDISISNGIVDMGMSNGVLLQTCSGIEISGVEFLSNVTGLFVTSCTNVTVQECVFRENTGGGLVATNNSIATIAHNNFFNHTSDNVLYFDNVHTYFMQDLNVTDNSSTPTLTVVSILSTQDMTLKHVSIVQNNSVSDLVGFFVNNSDTINLLDCSCSNNTAGDAVQAILANNANNLILNNTRGNNNIGTLNAQGFVSINSEDCILQDCVFDSNSSTVLTSSIIFIDADSDKVSLFACLVNNNEGASLTAIGCSGMHCTIQDCLVKANAATSTTAVGIDFASVSSLCLCRKNIIVDNSGTSSIGLDDQGSSNLVFTNFAQNQTTNFNGLPSPIISTYTISTGGLVSGGSGQPNLENFDLQP